MNVFYTIIISPILQIIEFVFVFAERLFDNYGYSIFAVSLAISLLCLPIYAVAEKWQQVERDIQKKLKPKAAKIKAAFSGDERYMLMSAYYRQHHYHPVYALRGSFGLLFQIPFFIAAYTFLSHQDVLKGLPFLFIADLGSPDGLFALSPALHINILPVLMTLVNIISATVYTKDAPLRDNIQLYGMAALFLVLLYNAPAALTLYWTCNNVFSLVKNLFYRINSPYRRKKLLLIIAIGFVVLLDVFLLFIHDGSFGKRFLVAVLATIVVTTGIFAKKISAALSPVMQGLSLSAKRKQLFFTNTVSLTLLTGFVIPVMVISSSPQEFSFIENVSSPWLFVLHAFLLSFGIFCFWGVTLYVLFQKNVQSVLSVVWCLFSLLALIHVFVLPDGGGGGYGSISNTFLFDTTQRLIPAFPYVLLNIILVLLAVGLLILLIKKWLNIMLGFFTVVPLVLLLYCIPGIISIQSEYNKLSQIKTAGGEIHTIDKKFALSKNERNIIIVMADRALNTFVIPVFDDAPALYEQYDGFALYPNTVSFNAHTIMGAPPIWGGYEYTPAEINKRADENLIQKTNEALLTLPRIFSDAGFHVTVTDPSWANHSWIPDIRIYENMKNVTAMNLIGRYNNLWYDLHGFEGNNAVKEIKERIFWFSLLKISPLSARILIYDIGRYWKVLDSHDYQSLVDSYAILDFLPELTAYDADTPQALFMTNEVTHNNTFTQYPDYVPVEKVTDRGNGVFSDNSAFHASAAFYHAFGEYLEDMKKNGVYDNTRIIIVADHGSGERMPDPKLDFTVQGGQWTRYNPVLMVKDFNAAGSLLQNWDFMTNADVPQLALDGIVDDPVNPWTGRLFSEKGKENGAFITDSAAFMAYDQDWNIFAIKNDEWMHVHDNVLDKNNWSSTTWSEIE
ncbi:MAG: membrane protein insertase YidC [Tannerella sp.]|nr:membrane protein insertase YidC [Tannerella sp.]